MSKYDSVGDMVEGLIEDYIEKYDEVPRSVRINLAEANMLAKEGIGGVNAAQLESWKRGTRNVVFAFYESSADEWEDNVARNGKVEIVVR